MMNKGAISQNSATNCAVHPRNLSVAPETFVELEKRNCTAEEPPCHIGTKPHCYVFDGNALPYAQSALMVYLPYA